MTERELLIMVYGLLSSAPEVILDQQEVTILTATAKKTIVEKIEGILNEN